MIKFGYAQCIWNDYVQETIQHRPRLRESPGRALLRQQLRLLVSNIQGVSFDSENDKQILQYVMSDNPDTTLVQPVPMTPPLSCLPHREKEGVEKEILVRRPSTATDTRPDSAASTYSAPAMLESFQHKLSVAQIDSVRDSILEALDEEYQQLLDDIDFVQVREPNSVCDTSGLPRDGK